MLGRDISTLPLSSKTVELLQRSGYRVYSDLLILLENLPSTLEFSSDLRVKLDEARAVLHELKSLPIETNDNVENMDPISLIEYKDKKEHIKKLTPVSVQEMLLKPKATNNKLVTFCKTMDKLFGGGIPVGQLTEICGVPGIGKTQLSTQLAINVQFPEVFPLGLNGKCIYIDTEGSFHIERARAMAENAHAHLKKMASLKRGTNSPNQTAILLSSAKQNAAENCTVAHFLNGIYLLRVHDSTELLAVVNRLSSLVDQCQDTKLIIIDSIAFPFRQNLHDVATRTRILAGVASKLQQIAYEKNVAVVVTNHVTSKFTKTKPNSEINEDKLADEFDAEVGKTNASVRDVFQTATELLPALGDTWSHAITNRVMLHFINGERCASLVKSSYAKCSSCSYAITQAGIRDVPNKEDPNKRPRT